ncbi:hypothetical protein HW555_011396 [Spodoptera exigua]|uniref:Uncharacterized protein n=1 Tax=Spodoptera exigua TaxID=7107 RepID=A0A835G7R9_SPOEX|nr:hypothetical protein HW555_011396 [Spodoptera exigua]
MSDLKVCRICLCRDVKIYSYDRFHLKQYYEEVLAKKINIQDGLPNCFCYECAGMLYKFHKFKEKCYRAEQALNELSWNGSKSIYDIKSKGQIHLQITLSSISKIDRQSKNLKSSINILSTNKRIRTFIIKSKTLKLVKKEGKNDKLTEFTINYNSDSSVDSQTLTEIKNEMLYEKEECKMSKEKINNDFENVMHIENEITGLEDDHVFEDNEEVQTEELNDFKVIKEEPKMDSNIEQENSFNMVIEEDKINHKKREAKKKTAHRKRKRFEVLRTEADNLDPSHWLKINLSEEEALDEFRARANDRKYISAAYKCTDCYKGFSKEDMINRHVKLRHCESVGPIVCRFCHMRFKRKCFLTRHISQHYTKYKCLRCDLICPLKNTALFHNDYHNGVIRKCMHCGEEFRHLSTYYTHLRTHRSEHVCTLCGASFVSVAGLSMHKRTMHVTTVVNREEEEINTFCSRCDIRFETRKAYEEHLYHSVKHSEDVDLNFQCNVNFPSLAAYMKHHSAQHKDEPLPTKEEERTICEICGASLKANSVASHLNTHTREKLYSCTLCHMQFNSKGSMNRHQLTHTGEKPHECSMCEKRFTQKSSMQLHFRTFHLKQPYPKRNRRKPAFNEQDGLPQYFCYECATILHKFHRFKEKCFSGQKALRELAWRGPITYELIYKLDPPRSLHTSPVTSIDFPSHIRSFISNKNTEESNDVFDPEKVEKIENIELNYFSETSIPGDTEPMLDFDTFPEHFEDEKIKVDSNEVSYGFNGDEDNLVNIKCEIVDEKKSRKKSKGLGNKVLNSKHWRKITLNEEEALKNFRARAEDKKYVDAAYKCSDCFRGFSKKDMLDRHLQLRHLKVDAGSPGMSFLPHEVQTELLPTEAYKAALCQVRVFAMSRHLSFGDSPGDDEEVDTYCVRCDITFETRKAFEEHLFHSALHSDGESNFDQGNNKKVLGKKEQAKITRSLRKRDTDSSILITEQKTARKRRKHRREHRKPTTCHQCGKHFETQSACLKHHLSEHPRTSFFPPNQRYICEICGSSLAPGSIQTHKNMHSREKVHRCDTCGREFHAAVGLKRHLLTHTGEKPYSCSLCDKRFTQSNSMKLHYRTFHLKEPYPKRVRRKGKELPKSVEQGESTSEEDSDSSLPDIEPSMLKPDAGIKPVTGTIPDKPSDDSMHYLTLT